MVNDREEFLEFLSFQSKKRERVSLLFLKRERLSHINPFIPPSQQFVFLVSPSAVFVFEFIAKTKRSQITSTFTSKLLGNGIPPAAPSPKKTDVNSCYVVNSCYGVNLCYVVNSCYVVNFMLCC